MKIQEAIEEVEFMINIYKGFKHDPETYKQIRAMKTLIEAAEKVREVLKEVESVKNVSVYTEKGDEFISNCKFVNYNDYDELKEKYNSLICVLKAEMGVFEDES